jgi:aminopeptidase N/puromycin-sensitive aminopeptidase
MVLKRVIVLLSVIFPLMAVAQRLPGNVVPEHYALTFTPDLQKATFAGQETIDVRIVQPGASITLNSAEIEFQQATITQNGAAQTAAVTTDPAKEQATLTFPQPLVAGPASLQIQFSGILNDKLRGFYLAKSQSRNYATTQFEATDARRAFPSFDEPALKSTFDVSLVVNKGDTAISNGRIISDTPGPAETQHTLKFSTSKKMSTYLVAMAVGDLQCNEGEADGIPIRVCGTPDKKALGVVALRYAEEILKYYDQYYGIKYPFEKLDIVGVPDFEAGAMENTAAIFYRETLLFIDDKNSSVDAHQAVFEVLAHEMAHQWFGDLVTMKWWDNLWLNEGFATWMALKPSQSLHPEWNATLDAVKATNTVMGYDALRNTHPIRAKAETPDQINELFDSISYEKAAAVLRMIEAYVSPEVFRHGVNTYLRKFSYGNATAEDFWSTIALASGRPVDKIMPTFVNQSGAPVVKVNSSCVTPQQAAEKPSRRKSRRVRKVSKPQPRTVISVSQQRFFIDADSSPDNQLWMIPVCVRSSDSKPFCQIIGQRQQTLPVSGCSQWVFTNANAVGYYRTEYDSEMLEKLKAAAAQQLSTAERMSLISDLAALMRSGHQKVGSFLDWVAALSQDDERAVVESYSLYLDSINDYVVTSADREAYHAWVRTTFRPLMSKIGWTPAAGEKDDTHSLRSDLIEILGSIGEDPETIRQSTLLAKQYLKDPNSVDASVASVVLKVAARAGDAALFDEYLASVGNMHSPEQYYNVGGALSFFRDPKLVERTLDMSVSPEMRNQDAPFRIAAALNNSQTQAVAWTWIKGHWPEVEKKLTTSNGVAIIGGARSFCSADLRDDVQQFFSEHKVPTSERALRQAVERINSCIGYREHQQGNLASWLGEHSPAGSAGR